MLPYSTVPAMNALILLRFASRTPFDACVREADLRVVRADDRHALVELDVPFPEDEQGEFAVRVELVDCFGERLPAIHNDTRGVLVARTQRPQGATYNELVQELNKQGRWITCAPLSEDERKRYLGAVSDAHFGTFSVPRPVAFTRAGPSTGTGALKTLPDLEAAGRSLPAAELRSVQEKFQRGEPITSSKSFACLLVRRSSAPPESTEGVNEVHPIGSDAYVLVTRGLAGLRDEVAVSLGGVWSEWTSENHDPRGVLVFPAACLSDVLESKDADAAIDRLGELGQWVKPTSMAALHKK